MSVAFLVHRYIRKRHGERLTWADDDPGGRADAGEADSDSIEGFTSWEVEGAAGGNCEDPTGAL